MFENFQDLLSAAPAMLMGLGAMRVVIRIELHFPQRE